MNLNNIIDIPTDWDGALNKQLNDSSLDLKDSPLTCSKGYSTEIGIFSLAFEINASAMATVFNSKEDTDDLENYSSPVATIGEDNTMLRYDLLAELNESIAGAFKIIKANFKANQDVKLSFYKIHSGTDKLHKALLQDIASLKTIYSDKDILSLAINEGLAVTFNGSLDAGISLSYSDVFTGTLAQLLKFLPEGTDIDGSINAGASLNCSVKIEDNFKVFIPKTKEDEYSININKSKSNTTTATAQIGISVQIDDDENSFSIFMENIFSALLGQPEEKVNSWVNTGLSKLNDKEKLLLTKAIQRIKIFEDASLADDIIQTQYQKYKKEIIEEVKKIISKKLEAGVSYEYQRSTSANTVFFATLTGNAVKENLNEILLMKVSALENKIGVNIKNYIFSKTESITKKFGFQLTIGKFEAYSFNKQEIKIEETQDKVNNKTWLSFSTQRSHFQGALNQKEWHFNLSGQTNGLVGIPATMNDFTYSSILHWEDQERKTRASELADFVEMGMIWDCIEADFDETCEDIAIKIKDKKNVKFSCEVNIPSSEMTRVVPLLAQSSQMKYLVSLCNAMPHYSTTWRKNVSDLSIYVSLWKLYLENGSGGDIEHYASFCERQLNALYPELAEWEYSFRDGNTTKDQGYESFIGLIQNSNLATGITNLQKGFKTLNSAIANKTPFTEKVIKKEIFRKIDDLVTSTGANKTFNITFLGRFLLDIARDNQLGDNISAKMIIEYRNDQNEAVEIAYMKSY